ncbi:alpha/beta hydrolase fold domain-containing protein [Levilactobacillus fujinensis]|uniref:Alpha/beta hydrolase fold domain-containing protein n=1 Tax=Levilactobacillus fujinensis TaxID=2486024 RepID=A0ABW1TI08_9LACO|nr:alpha/beta hydrolase fold domain-containing protein [Levilactobacillus fujinensis]
MSLLSQARKLRQEAAANHQPAPLLAVDREETLIIPTSAGEVPVYVHWPLMPAHHMIINFHGSEFIFPHNDWDRLFCQKLSYRTHAAIFDVDYPLAPEHPFPQPLEASYTVVEELHQRFPHFKAPTLIGHSTGGNLIIGTQLLALRRQTDLAQRLILDYPVLDLDTSPEEKPFPDGATNVIPLETAQLFNRFYRQNQVPGNPLISPTHASTDDLREFPATSILTADHDTLLTEAEAFGQQLINVGTQVTCRRYTDSRHGFTVNENGAYQQALNDMTRTILADWHD